MANLPESPDWEAGIYQLEESDPVKAGAEGIANLQPKQLANRTAWLKDLAESAASAAVSANDNANSRLSRAANLGDLESAGEARSNLGLGTAATATVTTSDTDATVGRVLRVGNFGVGSTEALAVWPSNSLNADGVPSGLYWTPESNQPNGRPIAMDGVLLHRQAGSAGSQLFFGRHLDALYFRRRTSATWQSWREIYHTSNILGTVSQSGGIPTGAIIERGSNANGEYVRYADGTQICYHRISTAPGNVASGTLWFRIISEWAFPAVFASTPRLTGTPDKIITNESGVNPLGFSRPTSGEVGVSSATNLAVWYSAAGSTIVTSLVVVAIGRWY